MHPSARPCTGALAQRRSAIPQRSDCTDAVSVPSRRAISPGCGVSSACARADLSMLRSRETHVSASASTTIGSATSASRKHTSFCASSWVPRPGPTTTALFPSNTERICASSNCTKPSRSRSSAVMTSGRPDASTSFNEPGPASVVKPAPVRAAPCAVIRRRPAVAARAGDDEKVTAGALVRLRSPHRNQGRHLRWVQQARAWLHLGQRLRRDADVDHGQGADVAHSRIDHLAELGVAEGGGRFGLDSDTERRAAIGMESRRNIDGEDRNAGRVHHVQHVGVTSLHRRIEPRSKDRIDEQCGALDHLPATSRCRWPTWLR